MIENPAPKLGSWACIALLIAAGTALLSDANRFLPPVGEKFAVAFGQGASDLIPSINAASALLAGQNPYHSDLKRFPDPYASTRGEAQHVTFLYPPTHFLIYVPVAWFSHGDFMRAARFQFYASLVVLLLLAIAVLDLLEAVVPLGLELRCALLAAFLFIFGLNAGNQLGLERGQSDILTAALLWWSAVAFRRGWMVCMAFLAVASVLVKGYGVVFAPGILLLGLRRGSAVRTLLGATLATVCLFAPVARYLPDAIAAYPIRADMYWSSWHNQSVYNLLSPFGPKVAGAGRVLFVVFALAVTLIAWLRLRRAAQSTSSDPSTLSLGLTLFTTAALISVVGYSRNSFAYNAVLPLPGALLLALAQTRLSPRASRAAQQLLGVVFALLHFGLCAFSVTLLVGQGGYVDSVPAHGAAVLVLLVLIGFVSARGITQRA